MNATITVNTWSEVEAELVKRSLEHGGAWIGVRKCFSNEVELRQYRSPCRVPDSMMDWARPVIGNEARIGYKGKLVGFTPAARIREQNRGISCE